MPDEYIKRADLIEARKRAIRAYENANVLNANAIRTALKPLLDAVVGAPAADVAPVVHEKWLLDRWPSWPHRECSRCKIMFPRTTEVADQYWQYCPNCGARMDGAAE